MSYFYAGYYLFRIFTCSFFLTCSFSGQACVFVLGLYKFACLFMPPCLFLYKLVSFLSTLCLFYPKPLSKRHNPVSFPPPIRVGHNYYLFLVFLFIFEMIDRTLWSRWLVRWVMLNLFINASIGPPSLYAVH